MNKLPLKQLSRLFLIILSIIIIITVAAGGLMHLTARIVLYRDISAQRKYLDYIRLNPPETISEEMFSNILQYQNPKINQIQYLSTHNSYKKKMPSFYYSIGRAYSDATNQTMHYQYAHNTLTEQLNNGIRGLELDIRYQFDQFYVYHQPVTDARTHNPIWKTTLEELLLWSSRNPGHTMVNIIIELKDDSLLFNPSYKKLTDELLLNLDKSISYTMGRNKLVTPSFLINNYDNLEEMVANNGWPSFTRTRGKFMFLLHYHNEYTDKYISLDQSLSSQIMVPMIESKYLNEYKEFAAVLLHNEPEVDFIQELVTQNYIVRTRMDINATYDELRARNAVSSGAQIISTDFPIGRELPKGNYNAFLEENYTIRLNPFNT